MVLYGKKIGQLLATQIGFRNVFKIAWTVLQWPLSFAAMFLSFSIIYYFGPNVEEKKWYWVTPGAVAGVALCWWYRWWYRWHSAFIVPIGGGNHSQLIGSLSIEEDGFWFICESMKHGSKRGSGGLSCIKRAVQFEVDWLLTGPL